MTSLRRTQIYLKTTLELVLGRIEVRWHWNGGDWILERTAGSRSRAHPDLHWGQSRAARQQAVEDAEYGIKAPGIWVVGQLDHAYCLFDMCGVLKSNIPWRVQIVRECNFPGLIEDWLWVESTFPAGAWALIPRPRSPHASFNHVIHFALPELNLELVWILFRDGGG